MIKASLFTGQGEFVAEVEIPAFDTWPEVLIWDVRTFVLRSEIPAVPAYREVFAYAVPTKDQIPLEEILFERLYIRLVKRIQQELTVVTVKR